MPEHKRFARTFYSLFLLSALLILSLAACGSGGSAGNASLGIGNISTPASLATDTTTATSTATATVTASATGVPLTVAGVDMAVSPTSLSSYTCGATVTVTYTATFQFPANNAGGQVMFQYTTDNGQSTTQAGLTVQPGETTAHYHFTWSGALPDDHSMPRPGGVMVSAPNVLNSQLVGPSDACSAATTSTFSVASIDLSASPSLTGQKCGGTQVFTETYTAVFHIAPNSPGGTIIFTYSTDNGQSSMPATLTVAAGRTSKTFTFTWKGLLPIDHTKPGAGIVMVTAPNQLTSPAASPDGQCS